MNKRLFPVFPKNGESLREIKRRLILRLILSQEKLSQAQLSRKLKLSRATVSAVVADLKQSGLIQEKGVGESTARGGKRPLVLGVNERMGHVLAIWIEGTKIQVHLLNLNGDIKEDREIQISENQVPHEIPSILANSINAVKDNLLHSRPQAQLLATGIAISGRVDSFQGRVLSSINYKMKDFPLGSMIESKTGIPVYVADYAVACALLEYWFGAAKGIQNFVFLRVLPFFKAVVFLNGEILFGKNFLAGEIGGSLAKMGFGKTECLCDLIDHEIFGIPKLSSRAVFGESVTGRGRTDFDLNAIEEFIEKMESSDKMGAEMDKLAEIVGQAATNVICYYAPELIILDGIPRNLQADFLEKVRKTMNDLLVLFPSVNCNFAFTQRDREYKARAILCMVFERLVSVNGQGSM